MTDPEVRALAREIVWLRRHVRQLEVASQAAYRSVEEGSFDFYDEDGILRERVGKQLDGTYGRQTVKGVVPPAPTEPDVVVISDGVVAVTWDGRFEEAYDGKGDFRNVQIHLGDSADFATSRQTQEGAIFARRGGTVVVVTESDVDAPQYVRLVATNRAGEAGPPSVATLVDEEDADNVEEEDEELEFYADTHAVTAPGPQSIQLTYEPEQESEHLYWNGLYQPGSEWSRVGQTITVPDAAGHLATGDELVVEYAYFHIGEDVAQRVPDTCPVLQPWYAIAGDQLRDRGDGRWARTYKWGIKLKDTSSGNQHSVWPVLRAGDGTLTLGSYDGTRPWFNPTDYTAPDANGISHKTYEHTFTGVEPEIVGFMFYILSGINNPDGVLAVDKLPPAGLMGTTNPDECRWYFGTKIAETTDATDEPAWPVGEFS